MMNGSNMMGGSWGSSGGGGGLDGILSTVTTLAVLIGIILLVFWLIRQYSGAGVGNPGAGIGYSGAGIGRTNTFAPSGETAIDILSKRYARGEIDSNEYQEKMSVLTSGS